MDTADLVNAILDALGDDDSCELTHDGIRIYCKLGQGDEPPMILRVVMPREKADIQVAYELCYSLIAETSNNDTCDLLIRERSAHYGDHPDLKYFFNEDEYVIFDAIVLDYMS